MPPVANRNRRPYAAMLALACAGAFALAGCGDSDDADNGQTAAGDATTETSEAPAGGRAGNGDGGDGPRLSGNRARARQAAVAIDDVYSGIDKAVEAGVSSVDVPVGETLKSAGDDSDLAHVCDLMTEAAQRQTIVYAKRSAGLADVTWTCERATGLLLRRARQTGGENATLTARIVSVDASGDRAIATVQSGGKNGQRAQITLVREDGKWKLGAMPSGGGGG